MVHGDDFDDAPKLPQVPTKRSNRSRKLSSNEYVTLTDGEPEFFEKYFK